MLTLTMCKWLPASWKSTRAKEVVKNHNWKYKRVNKDDLRAMLDNGRHSKSNEKYILWLRDYIITTTLLNWINVIVDDTNFNPIHEERLKELAISAWAKFIINEFNTPLNECIERDRNRENSVWEKVIRNMRKQYMCKTIEKDDDIWECIICDIDWTLAIRWDRGIYEEDKVWVDNINQIVHDIIAWESCYVFIVSWRHDSCREETEKRLQDKWVVHNWLFMRKADDNREDSIIKREIYEQNFKGKYNIKYAIDDRLRVLEMRVEEGIYTINVNQWNIRF